MSAGIDALAPLVGKGLRTHAAVRVDDVPVTATLAPKSEADLAEALAALAESGMAVLPRGAGTRAGLGNPPRRADCFLSLEHLDAVLELDASEGVCRVQAGVPLAVLRREVEAAGWELPLDDAGRGGSLGGALATASPSARAQGFGAPRDIVLGLELTSADGTRTRCGGRVVKNVTGYDLAKLHLGGLGRLGVITAAWLRLRPRPAARATLRGPALEEQEACRFGVEAARLPALRSWLMADAADAGLVSWVELAGDAASVAQTRQTLARAGFDVGEDAALDAVGATRHARDAGAYRFVVSSLPSGFAACVSSLRRSGAQVLAMPGVGRVCAWLADETPPDAAWAVARRAAEAGSGRFLCEEAPAVAKRGRDVFAATDTEAALTRRLVAEFDPRGVLNPGRSAGGI